MPTVNQLAPASTLGFDTYDTPLEQLGEAAAIDGSSIRHQSSTGFMWGRTAPIDTNGNHTIFPGSIIIQGSGFTYGGGGIPSGGTITSISICLGGNVIANTIFAPAPMLQITGLSMDVADLGNELFLALTGNPGPLEDYFLGLSWAYNGSNGHDSFEAGTRLDSIKGNGGDDHLYGFGGDDKLYGGDAHDSLWGGKGADYLSGGSDLDAARYDDASSAVTASLANPSINKGEAAGDTYNSIENLYGSNFNDALNGNNGVNELVGLDGNDAIKGYGGNDNLLGLDGNDVLIGGTGADSLKGGAGIDTASYAGAAVRVTVSLANPSINTGDAAGDGFFSIENLKGTDFNDYLFGDNGANTIDGGAGNDVLKGYGGNDILKGWTGKDIFVFNSALNAATNVDTLADFNPTADTIHLDNAVFTALTATGTLAASAFKDIAGGVKDSNDRIVYNSDTGALYYDRDGSGGTYGNIKFAVIATHAHLTAADFVVI